MTKLRHEIRALLNHRPIVLDTIDPGVMLLEEIRVRQRLTGTKEGCAEGDCGACTVLVGRWTRGGLHHAPILRAALDMADGPDPLAESRTAVEAQLREWSDGARVQVGGAILPTDADDLAEAFEAHILIGAGCTYSALWGTLEHHVPQVLAYWKGIGGRQVRAAGTIGGNIANGSPIGDTPPWLIAMGARLHLRKGAKRRDEDISSVSMAMRLSVEAGQISGVALAYGGMAGVPKRAAAVEAALVGGPFDLAATQAALARVSAQKHVTGAAIYTDYIATPIGTLHACLGLSQTARGRLSARVLGPVRAAPGVVGTLTAQDIPVHNDVSPVGAGDDPVFAEAIALLGQPVFAVVSETRDAARRAARLATQTVAAKTPVLSLEDATEMVTTPLTLQRGDAGAAMKVAPRRIAGSVAIGGQDHFYPEGQIALACPEEDGGMTIWSSTQHPSEVQHMVAFALGLGWGSQAVPTDRHAGHARTLAHGDQGAAGETNGVTVLIVATCGSCPREPGAWVFVTPDSIEGTIGGGRLEWDAIAHANSILAGRLEIVLGPDIGQCCGGRAPLDFSTGMAPIHAFAPVLIFGGGHVGAALARSLQIHRGTVSLFDTRAGYGTLTALPEADVRAAPSGAAFVILTHDHALDFLIAEEALARGDAACVGMIGSATKRKILERRLRTNGIDPAGLTGPIGASGRGDKRPEIIALHTAADAMQAVC